MGGLRESRDHFQSHGYLGTALGKEMAIGQALEDWKGLVMEMEAENAFKEGNEERQENRTCHAVSTY